MSKVAEFVSWKIAMDGDIDEMAAIISEANSQELIDSLVDICVNTTDPGNQRHFALLSKHNLDDYLTKEGWYEIMEQDRANRDECPGIIEQDAINAYNSRMGL